MKLHSAPTEDDDEEEDDDDDEGKKRHLQQFSAKLDYRNKGLVSSVKNQLRCGSCWAFAGTAVIESLLMKDKGY